MTPIKDNRSFAASTVAEAVPKVLLVDDEQSILLMLSTILSKEGYQVATARNGQEALKVLERETFDYVISDLSMPVLDGLGFLREYRQQGWDMPVIIMSAYGTVESAIEAIQAGAFDYVFKPFQPDEVLLALRKAAEREALKKENLALRRVASERASQGLIYRSSIMGEVMQVVQKVAEVKSPVLVTGESGTGKELVARAIHQASPRQQGPFVAVNCGAIPENLLESELFGHVRGAFTDAVKDREGLFREADRGTLFLDEVGELPQVLQVKLLRAIQFEEVRPVGGSSSAKVNVRIVAATARDMVEEVALGRFRDDLYYRLNVLPIYLPPLRKRQEDIPLLLDHFIVAAAVRIGRERPEMAPDALDLLINYKWPGNIRELENLVDRLLVMSSRQRLTAEDIPDYIKEGQLTPKGSEAVPAAHPVPNDMFNPGEDLDLKQGFRKLEAQYIKEALKRCGGNRSEAARRLGISYPNLLAKIKQYKF